MQTKTNSRSIHFLLIGFSLLISAFSTAAFGETQAECEEAGRITGNLIAEQYANVLVAKYENRPVAYTAVQKRLNLSCDAILGRACRKAMWSYLFKTETAVGLVQQNWQGAFASWHETIATGCAEVHQGNAINCPAGYFPVDRKICGNGQDFVAFVGIIGFKLQSFVYEYGSTEPYYRLKRILLPGERMVKYQELRAVQ